MNTKTSIDLTSIKWVLRELTPMLNDVQRAIVSYAEAPPEHTESLSGVAGSLRQIHGTVQILELYGAAMLAEEMEHIVSDLREETLSQRDEAIEVLMRAALQLPDYLERIKAGSPDVPLVLLPLLNDLRAARGEALLSESVLFVPDLSSIESASISSDEEAELTETVRSLRLPFMRSLLAWYKDEDDADNLERMSRIFGEIEHAAHSKNSRKIWPICRALVESLKDKGLESGSSIKVLFGQIERSLKNLLEKGEVEFVRALPQDLLKNLLYYIAQSTSVSPIVAEVRREYRLAELLPQREKLEQARRTHQGPSIELLQVANQGVRDDVSVIKDLVEIYVHAEDRKLSMLEPMDNLLRRVIDTMSMLGVGEARSFLEPKQDEIREMLSQSKDPGDDRLFDIAAALLKVEDMLDKHITDQTSLLKVEPPPASDTADILSLRDLPEREYGALIQTLVKESLRNFARTREAFIDYATQTENAHNITNVPGLLGELIGVFEIMLNKQVLPLLIDLSSFMTSRYVRNNVLPNQFEQELIADTITSIEYYIESIPDDESEREHEYVLGVSRSALDQLVALSDVETAQQSDAGQPKADSPQVADPADGESAPVAGNDDPTLAIDLDTDLTLPIDSLVDPTVQIDHLTDGDMENDQTIQLQSLLDGGKEALADNEDVGSIDDVAEPEPAVEEEIPETPVQPRKEAPDLSNLRTLGDDVDEEILEIFIEEALDEMATINEHLPSWRANTDDEQSLTRLRRSYHTLKGSGRLLGAERIAEFAWCNENMLNYLMRGDLQVSDKLFELMNESASVLPQLIAQLRGEGNEVDISELVNNIRGLVDNSVHPTSQTSSESSPALPTLEEMARPAAEETELPPADGSSDEVGEIEETSLDPLPTEDDDVDVDAEDIIEFEALDVIESETATDEAETPLGKASETESEDDVDPELLDIFCKESQVHLNVLADIHQQSSGLSGSIQPSDQLIRALHTLRGSARAAKVVPIAQLAAPLENIAKHKRDTKQIFDREESQFLKEVTDGISESLSALQNGGQIPDHINSLITRVDSYSVQVMATSVAEPPPADDGDAELREIFIEEADELLESTERIIAQWREAPQDITLVAEMKRPLHTLKGGARMAGYTRVADLTHALESSVVAREAAGDAPADNYFDLLQEAIDALAVNVEQARGGQEIGRFDWIVDDLNNDTAIAEAALVSKETSEAVDGREAESGEGEVTPSLEPLPPQTEAPGSVADVPNNVVPLRATASAIETALQDHSATSLAPAVARGGDDKAQEQVRVRAELLDSLVNNAGEVNIYQARFGQQIGDMRFNLNELEQTVQRLREQLRQMDQETEAQILYGFNRDKENTTEEENPDFDPLELDRYSQIQELSRSLLESVSDLDNLKTTLTELTRDSETLMLQQSRISTELQDGLLRTRMVRFDGVEARLSRVVRQTAQSLKKKASLIIDGGENEIDRSVQERMIAPIEHILRNAVAHGIELPETREALGKSASGTVAIRLSLDGGDILIRIVDDGGGIDIEAVRRKGVEHGLVKDGVKLSEQEVIQLLFESGFSTAEEVTQIAGRGVGLDVVGLEIQQLGGSFTLESEAGVGTMFVIRLPQTLAISQALMVSNADDLYAIPINGIRGVSRIDVGELSHYYLNPDRRYNYGGEDYRVIRLTELLNLDETDIQREPAEQAPLIMVRSGDEMAAVQVDELAGRREIVVKGAGPQIGNVRGIAGATLLGDGRVVLVLDIGGMLQTLDHGGVSRELSDLGSHEVERKPAKLTVMVVDDSITIRKVTTRALERYDINVITAKDGVDAVSKLKENKPDLMLLDIEMPRMDGFEVAGFVRNDARLSDLPIIVITSRTGEKHRQRAFDIGVNEYLGKPYQEAELIRVIGEVLDKELVSQ